MSEKAYMTRTIKLITILDFLKKNKGFLTEEVGGKMVFIWELKFLKIR